MPKVKQVENPPGARRNILAMRDLGYSFNTAVADIIDNSISHGDADNIYIIVDYTFNGLENFMIIDDGKGIRKKDQVNIMKYGSDMEYDNDNLGKYGVGLKTASTSMCNKLSVISKSKSDGEPHKIVWDLDFVAKTNKWVNLLPDPDEYDQEQMDLYFSEKGIGTIVRWQSIDRILSKIYVQQHAEAKALEKKISDLQSHLEATFQRFLDRENFKDCKKVNIYIEYTNQRSRIELKPFDPFCKWSSETKSVFKEAKQMKLELEDELLGNIKILPYIIPIRDELQNKDVIKKGKLGDNDLQGFYVYRNNRLIQYGGWFGMVKVEPHITRLRVLFEFDESLDGPLQLNVLKTRIALYPVISKTIKGFISSPMTELRAHRSRSKNPNKGGSIHDTSSKIITGKSNALTKNVKITKIDDGKARISNKSGTLVIDTPTFDYGNLRVVPTQTKYGVLWDKAIDPKTDNIILKLNNEHQFYKKIYEANKDNLNVIHALDLLLYSMVLAELEYVEESDQRKFEKIRLSVSEKLDDLLENFQTPDE